MLSLAGKTMVLIRGSRGVGHQRAPASVAVQMPEGPPPADVAWLDPTRTRSWTGSPTTRRIRKRATRRARRCSSRSSPPSSSCRRASVPRSCCATCSAGLPPKRRRGSAAPSLRRPAHTGRHAVGAFIALAWKVCGNIRLVPASANRQPAFAMYTRRRADAPWSAHAIHVLALERDMIATMTLFVEPAGPPLFPAFGLPLTLPEQRSLSAPGRRAPRTRAGLAGASGCESLRAYPWANPRSAPAIRRDARAPSASARSGPQTAR